MWTEAGPLRQMRAAARAALPPRAFLRLDRGDFLLVTNAGAFDPALREIPGFIVRRRGALMYLLPDAHWIDRLERRPAAQAGMLCTQLAQFRGVRPDLDNLKLFARCVRMLDSGRATEAAACERLVRQRAAVALRGGCGGGLYACARLLQIYTDNHGEV